MKIESYRQTWTGRTNANIHCDSLSSCRSQKGSLHNISWNVLQGKVVESQGVTLISGLKFLYTGDTERNLLQEELASVTRDLELPSPPSPADHEFDPDLADAHLYHHFIGANFIGDE